LELSYIYIPQYSESIVNLSSLKDDSSHDKFLGYGIESAIAAESTAIFLRRVHKLVFFFISCVFNLVDAKHFLLKHKQNKQFSI